MSASTARACRLLSRSSPSSVLRRPRCLPPSSPIILTRGMAKTPPPTPEPVKRHDMNPSPRHNPLMETRPTGDINVGGRSLGEDIAGKAFVVTGGAQGLGLALAEGLVEAGGIVYCLDRASEPHEHWKEAQLRSSASSSGKLHYRQQDVADADGLESTMSSIADSHGGIQGVIAAAGIQQVTPAVEYDISDVSRMLAVNYTGVFATATSAARQMMRHKTRGSIVFVASMSGIVANKGLVSPVYNSSKAAVLQLAKNLAMEWTPVRKDGTGGIRVNCISPGHIVTPMVLKNFEEVPGLRETWEQENMMGRLAEPSEFKGASLFLLSNTLSSFVTGANLVIDGGHTAW